MIRRHYTLLLLVAVAFIGFAVIPGCFPDRVLLSLSTFAAKDSRSFFTGDGSQASPYRLHTFGLGIGKTPEKKPTIISINDDPDQVFQASPPSPVDFAIILRNLKRLGMDRVAISFPLTWEETDAISLAALDRQLDAIPALATAAPLSRGAVPSPIPPAFRRASVPLSEIRGNTELLPAVNRIAIPNAILGNKTSLAGFTRIESEPEGASPYLLARWGEDHAVLSFVLIAAMDHYQIPPSALQIRLGEFISLSARGPFIPIDEYGRLDFSIPTDTPGDSIAMESLLRMDESKHNKNNFLPAILRSDLSATEDASAAYAKSLAPTIAALCDPTYAGDVRTFRRLPLAVEIFLLLSLVSLAYGLFHSRKHPWKADVAAAVVGISGTHFIAVATTSTWLPTLPALLIFVTYAALSFRAAKKFTPVSPHEATPTILKEITPKQ
ncbi:MAG: hypothetical protein NWT08_12430 [Akkermansiaceae bacterium]|nr:hypothetical protein [Akkermansiaceae bacterium]MDP4722373.1 hypothetical protein [Akkermansiaceae bacterium]MDP4899001.1 hypothetical protein [Akkermansiaceae bacterium]MDP4996495.1 hypothetical protein [Akkermansiaceae bacterium]